MKSNQLDPASLPRRIHLLGICGRMVGGLALALHELGLSISGSDARQFPPMSDLLAAAGIKVNEAWSRGHLPRRLDAVVTGGAIEETNPELVEARRRGVPIWNATSFLEEYFLRHSENMVVAGTKGKTTTTAMLAWILHHAGWTPNFLIGGVVRKAGWPLMRLNQGPVMVLEGDEYSCSLRDPAPKFLRYHPRHLVVTNVRLDHPDRFPTEAAYRAPFELACASLPKEGNLILNADDAGSSSLAGFTSAPVTSVGFSRQAIHRITGFRSSGKACRFQLDGVSFCLRLSGRMNVQNAALAAVTASVVGVSLSVSSAALADFPGVLGRQELLARIGDSWIYSDEAYHPLAVRAVLDAIKSRHPKRKIIVVFAPSYTGGRGGIAQRELPSCLASAASAAVLFPACDGPPSAEAPFDDQQFCRDLITLGVMAKTISTLTELVQTTCELVSNGDILLICMPPGPPVTKQRILKQLEETLGHPAKRGPEK